MYKFSNRSLERMNGIDPQLQQLMINAIAKSPIDFGIPEDGGLRTAKRQNELYRARKSQLDGITKKSNHQSGRAVDVYAYLNGSASWDDVHLAIIAGVVLSEAKRMGLNVRWGGTFGSKEFHGWDKPHFELI
jgi:peptidoglycan L-alanyl-D-glutamate endopeptidase CwlK